MSIRFVTETEQVTKRCCKTTTKNISTDNVVYDRNDIKYDATTVVPKNTILTAALNNIVQFFKVIIDDIKQQLNISNVGTGAKIYAGNTLLGNRKLRTLVSSDDSVSIQETEEELDITVLSEGGGGNQNLQSVLDNGGSADFNNGNQFIRVFDSNTDPLSFEIGSSNAGISTSLITGLNGLFLSHSQEGTQQTIEIQDGRFVFQNSTTNGITELLFDEPQVGGALVNIKIPSKSASGTYILATLDDIKLKEYTVATLPVGTKGDVAFVNNALTPTFLAPVVGGGSAVVQVFHNGTTWIVQ